MADVNGMPDVGDLLVKMLYAAPDTLPTDTDVQISNYLRGVIAEFQSPPGLHGIGGGTGRSFTPVQATRTFDGNGYPELMIDDAVSGAALQVQVFDAVLPDVVLKQSEDRRRWNLLVRPQSTAAIQCVPYGISGIFPTGLQNISVTTTWGNVVTDDVFLAILCETTSRMLIEGYLGLDGTGGKLTIGTFSVDQAGAASLWLLSSTPGMMHTIYTNCVSAYRDRGQRQWKRMAASRRMS